MSILKIELTDELTMMLAVARGWQPQIEDESQEMVDDSYPLIPNPVSKETFLENYIPQLINDYVLEQGKNKIISNFNSKFDSIKHALIKGDFDELILNGQFDQISAIVKSGL